MMEPPVFVTRVEFDADGNVTAIETEAASLVRVVGIYWKLRKEYEGPQGKSVFMHGDSETIGILHMDNEP